MDDYGFVISVLPNGVIIEDILNVKPINADLLDQEITDAILQDLHLKGAYDVTKT